MFESNVPSQTRSRRRGRSAIAAAALASLVLAACGSDGDSATTAANVTAAPAATSGAPATAAPDATTAPEGTTAPSGTTADSGSSGAVSGDPVVVMTVAPIDSTALPPYPNIPGAAQLYEQWVNDNGGINGRPLKVIVCDEKGDPNEAANCGRQAVDQKVVAMVGGFAWDPTQLMPNLEASKLAWFGGCCPIASLEFTSPVSFPMGSAFAIPTGIGKQMIEDGCKNPGVALIETPSTALWEEQAKNGMKAAGFDPSGVKVVTVPGAVSDFSAQAAEVTSGTDCLMGMLPEGHWAAFLTAVQSAGGTQRIYGSQGNLNANVVKQFPELTNKGVLVNAYPDIAGTMWDDYSGALVKYNAPDLDWNSLAGLGTWAAFAAFRDLVTGMTDINNVSFLDAANAAKAVDTGGMTPVLDFTTPYTGGGGTFPRIFNRSVTYDSIADGAIVVGDGTLHNMTDALEGKA